MSINTKPPVIKGHIYCKNERMLALGMVNDRCIFCGTNVDDESTLGEFILHTHTGWKMHYFCLTLSSGLQQTVDEESSNTKNHPDHVFGFTIKKIFLEVKRARRLKCSYCKKPGASIGCIVSKCKKMMHVPCSVKNRALSRFYHDFSTLCNHHRPNHPVYDNIPYYQRSKNGILSELVNANSKSETDEDVSKSLVIKHKVEEPPPAEGITECSITCSACLEDLHPPFDQSQIIVSPCCMNLYTHKICLQRHANSCGLHFFRCPGCNNTPQFQQHMLEMGIFIPDRDAAWESESHAFSELLQRYNKCDAVFCLCPHGRDHISSGIDSDWKIVLCDMCGSSGTHIGCHPDVSHEKSYFVCAQCLSTFGEDGAFNLAKQMGIIVEKRRKPSPGNGGKSRRKGLQRKLAIEAGTAPHKSKPVAPRKTIRRRPTTAPSQPRKRPSPTPAKAGPAPSQPVQARKRPSPTPAKAGPAPSQPVQARKRPSTIPAKAGPAPKKSVTISESNLTRKPCCKNTVATSSSATTQPKGVASRKTVASNLAKPETSRKLTLTQKTTTVSGMNGKSSQQVKPSPAVSAKPIPSQKQKQTVSFQPSTISARASPRSKPTAPRKTVASAAFKTTSKPQPPHQKRTVTEPTPQQPPPRKQLQQKPTVSFPQDTVSVKASARSKPTAPRKTLAHRKLPAPTPPKPRLTPTPTEFPAHEHNTRASSSSRRSRNTPTHATRSSAFHLYPAVDMTLRRRRVC